MKIIQIISSLGNGGAEKFVVELSNELAIEHDVMLISFRQIEDWMYFPKRLSPGVTLKVLDKKNGFDASIYLKLWKIFKTEKPDVVHFHLKSVLKYLLPLSLFFLNRPKFIYTIHSKLNEFNRKDFVIIHALSILFQKIVFVCLTDEIKEDFQNNFNRLQFFTVQNGIVPMKVTDNLPVVIREISSLKNQDIDFVFLSVGRIDKWKNYSLLNETFRELTDKNILAIVIGDKITADKEILENLELGKPDNVFYIGKRGNVADYLAVSDAFVMTSLFEGMPIAVIEAFSMAKPIVCTPAGGLTDMVQHGKNGFISKDFTKESFAEAIKAFLALDPAGRKRMGEASKKLYLDRYSITKSARRYLELYEN